MRRSIRNNTVRETYHRRQRLKNPYKKKEEEKTPVSPLPGQEIIEIILVDISSELEVEQVGIIDRMLAFLRSVWRKLWPSQE